MVLWPHWANEVAKRDLMITRLQVELAAAYAQIGTMQEALSEIADQPAEWWSRERAITALSNMAGH